MVVGQDDVAHVFVHPKHQTLFVEAKYDYDFSQNAASIYLKRLKFNA
ncbi:MAG: hypothetical protein HC817_13005 [Saprospiraceae bacterium]|nr:hypothetical protein [Saprospiraceae bacterium]